MRYCVFLWLMTASAPLLSQTNVVFKDKLTYTGKVLANLWGYAAGGNEYALVGTETGTSIVNVTDPANVTEITEIDGPDSEWREIKTYQHYAYVVSEGTTPAVGIQIINLTNLPGSNLTYKNYKGDGAIENLLTKAHALQVDEVRGYLYIYGSNLNSGKPLIFNLNNDPYNPQYVGSYTPPFSPVYAHDGYANNDTLYSAHISAGKVAIVDMTNKTSPVTLATFTTPNAFSHNTWRYGNTLFTTDEKSGAYLTAYDISNMGNVTELDRIRSNPGSGSIVHNTYIRDHYAITSWYKDGFTIVDAARPANLIQVGNYDTYPTGAGNGFNGCWGVYPYLPSGNILVSNIDGPNPADGELWVLTPTYVRGCYVEGFVYHAITNAPINGALVKLVNTSTQYNSIGDGSYRMGQLTPGAYTLQVSKTGFITNNTPVTLTNGVLTFNNIYLQPVAAPVEWAHFDARPEGQNARLHWATASEANNEGFTVEYSVDGLKWRQAGFVSATGSPQEGSEYHFTVYNLVSGTYYFRLVQQDLSGATTYSVVRQVQIERGGLTATLTASAASQYCHLKVFHELPQHLTVTVLNAGLQPVVAAATYDFEGEFSIPIQLAELPAGVYFVAVRTETEQRVLRLLKN